MTDRRGDDGLGMSRPITRRDFLDGLAWGAAGALLAGYGGDLAAAPPYYPPGLTGLSGDHEGSYVWPHRLRDGDVWNRLGRPRASGERYDLVIVGGGISGLAAAWFYRRQVGPRARILILDNHRDFGGHAIRNELVAGGRRLISYGGTQSIESPADFSDIGKQLLTDLGIHVKRFYTAYDQKLYPSMHLSSAYFFDRETFGRDALVTGVGSRPWPKVLKQCPLSETARRDIARLYADRVEYLPGMTVAERRARLSKISYATFLTQICKASPDVLPFFQALPHDLFCVGIDAVSALELHEAGNDYGFEYPGFAGMALGQSNEGAEPYIFHFPDGNASIARMLVRALIPGAIEGHDMEDVVTARADYSRLDRPGQALRIRLNSTAVRARHTDGKKTVEVSYVQNGHLYSVQGAHCILACHNAMIPYVCTELPETQRAALSKLIKAPLVYTHVGIRNWQAWQRLGVYQIEAPGSFHSYVALDDPVSLGRYHFPKHPHEPAVLFMLRTPCSPGLPMREQNMAGRAELLQTSFKTFEHAIRDQLGRMLGHGGFDPARDIESITVNRWAHGYSFGYSALWDPDWEHGQEPWVIGRRPFGRIAIANCDSGGDASTDVAVVQAYRAVKEIREGKTWDPPERKRRAMPHE